VLDAPLELRGKFTVRSYEFEPAVNARHRAHGDKSAPGTAREAVSDRTACDRGVNRVARSVTGATLGASSVASVSISTVLRGTPVMFHALLHCVRVAAAANFGRFLKRLAGRSVADKRRAGTGRRALADEASIEANLIVGPDAHA
jgi:hypothetical protein